MRWSCADFGSHAAVRPQLNELDQEADVTVPLLEQRSGHPSLPWLLLLPAHALSGDSEIVFKLLETL